MCLGLIYIWLIRLPTHFKLSLTLKRVCIKHRRKETLSLYRTRVFFMLSFRSESDMMNGMAV